MTIVMNLSCHHILLAPSWADEDEARQIVLVDSIDALWLCRDGEYKTVPAWATTWEFERQGSSLAWHIRSFASQSNMMALQGHWLREESIAATILRGIDNGELVGIRRKHADVSASKDPVIESQRLVRDLESKTRGRLSEGGRQFKLVAGADLPGIPDRDSYEVVSNQEARRVLGTWVEQAGTRADLATLLGKAQDMLSPDWHPPMTANGVVLLRKIIARHVASVTPEAAITPSQLRAMLETEKLLQFFARFVDERGKQITGFSGKFEHGSDAEVDMPFSSSGFSPMRDLKGARQAWLRLAEEETKDLVDELKKRWSEIRGKTDEAWKSKEESLIEVLFNEGKLPELTLEAEKKHTFMLRPPVAVAKLSGMYFHVNRCFLLPTAVASLKCLMEIYRANPDSEVLIVGHADAAGDEDCNLQLSCERAEAMKNYLTDDVNGWLAWYEKNNPARKRWGRREDILMIEALVPEEDLADSDHVTAFQEWHNSVKDDTQSCQQSGKRPVGWMELEVDGKIGPKTRRQLILDYMAIDGTSLPIGTRVVTYSCGDYFPHAQDDPQPDRTGDRTKQKDRRVEIFFFAKPFGILPPVPGVADGESSKDAVRACSDKLYPEWRTRAQKEHLIGAPIGSFRLWLCEEDMSPMALRPFTCKLGDLELTGNTDDQGFVLLPHQEPGTSGWIEVSPDERNPDYKVRCEIEIGVVASPRTPLGSSTRLNNLGYYMKKPCEELTDELVEAIRQFQMDQVGLAPTGVIDRETSDRLRAAHEPKRPALLPDDETG
jgi:outer membrane protein OmpA-like peptidoglycan-associated protein